MNCSFPLNTCYDHLRQLKSFGVLNRRGCLDMDFGEEKKDGGEGANSPNLIPLLLRFAKNHHSFAHALALSQSTIVTATTN